MEMEKEVNIESPPNKKPLHIILFFVINLYFAFALVPFLASGNQPKRNTDRLNVYIVDMDKSIVGSSLLDTANLLAGGDYFPTFQVKSTYTSIEDVKKDVLNGK